MSEATARILSELLKLSEAERAEVASALLESLGASPSALTGQKGHSVLDVPTASVGKMLKPLGTREEWYDEMLEDRFPLRDQKS